MPLRVACVQTPPPLPSVTQATFGQTVKQVRANAETVINDAAGNLKKTLGLLCHEGNLTTTGFQ